jgi:CheY-like chemotaxis protein
LTWLIAEDETDIRNLVALMCQAWGHVPLTFENGQRVWDWLDSIEQNAQIQVPELILMDIRMPGKKGNELAHRMRTLSILERTPIVLMTAYTLSDNERQEMMTNDGVDLILAKPLPDFDQLRAILHNVGRKQADQVGEHAPVSAEKTQEASAAKQEPAAVSEAKPPENAKKKTGELKQAAPSKKKTGELKQAENAADGKQTSLSEATKQPDNVGGGKQTTS